MTKPNDAEVDRWDFLTQVGISRHMASPMLCMSVAFIAASCAAYWSFLELERAEAAVAEVEAQIAAIEAERAAQQAQAAESEAWVRQTLAEVQACREEFGR
jgi:hypothetical protein